MTASRRTAPKRRPGAVDELLARAVPHAETREALPAPPRLGLCVVTCMDARIDPAALLGLAPGDAHVVRTAGALVTPDVLRALAISQNDGGTTEILVVHHTCCVALGVMEPGRSPEDTVAEAVARIRGEETIPHRDRVAGAVLDLATGALREVDAGVPAHAAA